MAQPSFGELAWFLQGLSSAALPFRMSQNAPREHAGSTDAIAAYLDKQGYPHTDTGWSPAQSHGNRQRLRHPAV